MILQKKKQRKIHKSLIKERESRTLVHSVTHYVAETEKKKSNSFRFPNQQNIETCQYHVSLSVY